MSNVVMVLMDGVNGWSGGKLHDINKAGLVISEERCRKGTSFECLAPPSILIVMTLQSTLTSTAIHC